MDNAINSLHPIFRALANMTQGSVSISAPVTITLRGTILSGYLISEEEFTRYTLDRVIEGFEKGNPGEVGQAISASLKGIKLQRNADAAAELPYLFLKDVRILRGNDLFPDYGGTHWSIAVDSIDGITFGAMAPADE